MSGDGAFASKEKPKRDPYAELLRIEDDRRLTRFLETGMILGAAFMAYALTVEIQVRRPPPPEIVTPDSVTVRIPENFYADLGAKHNPPKVAKRKQMQGEKVAERPKSRQPSKENGTLGIKLVTSKGNRKDLSAYDLLLGTIDKHLDMDKIERTAQLSRTDPSRYSGRMGRHSTEYSGYHPDGTSDEPGGTAVTMPEGSERITSRLRASDRLALTTESSIDFLDDKAGLRSTASIMMVIRSHSSGLRRVYNKFLKLSPGLSGKVTLRFAIAPRGEVLDAALVSSTTHLPEFDREVVRQVLGWRFEPIRATGNDIVTVPLTFSE